VRKLDLVRLLASDLVPGGYLLPTKRCEGKGHEGIEGAKQMLVEEIEGVEGKVGR
jgi:hypothetical protein